MSWEMSLLCSVLALHLASKLSISHFQDCLQNAASGAPHGQLPTFELERCLKIWRNSNEFSYVVGNQSGWVGKLTQNFLNPLDIPSRP